MKANPPRQWFKSAKKASELPLFETAVEWAAKAPGGPNIKRIFDQGLDDQIWVFKVPIVLENGLYSVDLYLFAEMDFFGRS